MDALLGLATVLLMYLAVTVLALGTRWPKTILVTYFVSQYLSFRFRKYMV